MTRYLLTLISTSLFQYLDEDFQKFSDTGEAGRIEAELEFEEQTKLLKENEAENARIAGIRQLRLAREEEETKTKIKQRLQEAAQVLQGDLCSLRHDFFLQF